MTNAGITDCTLHYAVLAAGSPVTAETLLANANDGVASYQSQMVSAGDTFQLTFEFGVGAYVFHSIFARTDGTISALTTASFSVLTAPTLGAPMVSDSGVTISVTNSNAAGRTLCYLFLDVMTDAPDTTEVFEDQGGAVWAPSGVHDVLLPALPAGTYTLYAYFHGAGVGSVLYTHAAPLRVLPVPTLSIVSAPGSGATVSVSNSDATNPYTFHYVVLFADGEAPSASYILDNYVEMVQVGATVENIVLSGFPGGAYRFYGIFDDGEVSSLVASTAPFTILHTPHLEAYVSGGLNVTVYNDGPTDCALHYVLLDAASDVPSTGFTSGTHYGTMPVAALSSFDVPLSDLPAGDYRFHAYFSSVGNSAVASTATLTVLHTPRFGTPVVSGTGATIAVSNDAAVTYNFFYKVLAAAEDVPNVFDITSGGFDGLVSVDAGATENVVLSGLSGGAYRFYGLFGASDGSTSAVSGTDPFTILHAPVFGEPSVSDADLTLAVQNDGKSICTLHYVVLDESASVPSASAILAHSEYDSLVVPNGSPATVLFRTFSASGTFRLHGYFEASGGAFSLVSSTTPFTVIVPSPALHVPRFDTPVVSDADLALSVHNDGGSICTLHYVILDESVPVPSASAILSHPAYDSLVVPNGPPATVLSHTFSISGTCRLHGYFESGAGVVSLVSSTTPFTVIVPAPALHVPRFDTPVVSDADLALSVHNDGGSICTLHYVILDESVPVPSASAILSHPAYDSLVVPNGPPATVLSHTFSISGTCRLHGYFESGAGVVSLVSSTTPFAVTVPAPGLHAPIFEAPMVSGADLTLTVQNGGEDTCTLHYAVLAATEDALAPGFTMGDRYGTVAVPALGTADVAISDLSEGTCRVHGYFSLAGAHSSVVRSDAFTVGPAVPVNPIVPSFTGVTVSDLAFTTSVANSGVASQTLYYVFLEVSEGLPSVTDIDTNPDRAFVTVPGFDSSDPTASLPLTHTFLVGGTYVLHGYFSDVDGAASMVVSTDPFVVTAPTAVPVPVLSTPSVVGLAVTLTVTHTGTSDYTFHYVAQDASESAPLAAAFSAHPSYDSVSDVAAGGADIDLTFSDAGTYRVYGYFESTGGERSDVVPSEEFTVAPVVASVPVPILSSLVVSGTEVTVSVTPDASVTYTLHYVVLDASADAPATGFTTGDNYDTESLPPGDDVPVSVSGLSPGSYIFHAYLHDGTSPSEVSSSDPFTVLHPPRLDAPEVSGTGVSVTVYNDGPTAYALHYVVQDASAAAPAPGFAGTDHGMVADGANVTVTVTDLAAGSYIFHAYFSSVVDSAVASSASFDIVAPPPAPQITSLAATGAAASFNIINPDPFEGYTLYYVFLEASAAAPTAQEIRDNAAHMDAAIPTGPPPGTALTHTFSESGMYRLYAYFESTAGLRSDVTSSSDTIDVTVTTASFLPVLGEPVVVGSQVHLMITNNDAASYGLQVTFSPTSASVAPVVVPSTIAGGTTVTITEGLPALRPGVDYEAQVVFQDAILGASELVTSSSFVLLHTPRLEDLSVLGEEVRVTVHNDGVATCTVHYVVLVDSADIPDAGFGPADYATAPHLYGSVSVAARAFEEISVAPMPDAALSLRQFKVHAYFSYDSADSGVTTSETIPILFAPQFGTTIGGTEETPIVSVENTFSNSSAPTARYTFHYLVLEATEAAPDTGFTTGATYGTVEVAENTTFEVPVTGVPNGAYKLHGYFSVGTSSSLVASTDEFTVRSVVPRPVVTLFSVWGSEATLDVYNEGSEDYTLRYVVLDASAPPPSPGFTLGTRYATTDVAAGGSATIPVVDLSPGDYVLYAYFHSAAQGLNSGIEDSRVFTILLPPRFDAPVVSGSTLDITIHNGGPTDCRLHYQVLPATAAVPSPGFVTGLFPHYYGAVDVVSAMDFFTLSLTLTTGTYVVYAYFEDDGVSAVSASDVFSIVPAPIFGGSTEIEVYGLEALISVRNPEPIPYTLYLVSLAADAPVPDVAAIRTNAGTTMHDVAGGDSLFVETGVSAGPCRLHGFFEASDGSVSAVVSSERFEVPLSPVFAAPPTVSGSSVTFTVHNNGFTPYTLHYILAGSDQDLSSVTGDYSTVAAPRGSTTVTFDQDTGGSYVIHAYFSYSVSRASEIVQSPAFNILHAPTFGPLTTTDADTTVPVSHSGGVPCTLHYVFLEASVDAPSASEIRAHADAKSVLDVAPGAPGVSATHTFSSSGYYRLHAFFAHGTLGDSPVARLSPFTVTVPGDTDLLAPHFTAVIVDSSEITITLAATPATYTLYYVVFPAADAKPTSEAIRSHPDRVQATAVGGTPARILLRGISPPGDYKLHAFFEDSRIMASAVSSSDTFTVTVTPPQLGAPSVVDGVVTVSVANSSTTPYTLYYEVLASSSPAPTSAALLASTSFGTVSVGAGATERVSVSSLSAGSYIFYAVFVDGTGVPSEVVSSDSFSIVLPVRPPVLGASSYLAPELVIPVTNPGETACTLYYVVLPAVTPVPTANDIKAASTFSGNVRVAPSQTVDVSVRGLSLGSHRFHAFFEDEAGTPSLVSSSSGFTISSDAILYAPSLGAPSTTALEATIPVTNVGGAACTLYYVALPSDRPVPSTSSIQSATAFSGSMSVSSGATVDVVVQGLPSAVAHKFHAFFETAGGMPSLVSSSDPFTLTPAPVVVSAPQLGAPSVVDGVVTVSVTNPSTVSYTLYYEVLASSSPAPTAADLLASASSGTVTVGAGATERVSVSSLSAGSYIFYAVFVDGTGVPSEVASSDSFSIVVRPPVLGVPSYPAPVLVVPATNPGETACTLYYVVLPAATPVPAANDIKAASTFSGNVRIAPGQTVDISVRGLSVGSYRFHAFFEDEAGMSSLVRSSSGFTISSDAILHAPSLGTPSTTAQEATIPVTNVGGAACTLYYAALPSDHSVPSTSNIQGATDFSGSMSVSSGATVDVVIQGLPFTAYRLHAFFETADGTPSPVSSSDPFTLTPAPQLGAPSVVDGVVTVSVTNPGTVSYTLYYEVLASSSPVPTAAALLASTSSGTVTVGAGATERVSVSSLSAGSYIFHAVFVDGTGVPSEVASSDSFSISVRPPTLGAPSYSSPDLVIPATNPGDTTCTLYYVVLPAATPVPAANDIKNAGTFSGNVRIAPRHTVDVSVQGLSPGSYIFHAFFEDEADAPSSVRSSDTFAVPPDTVTAPRFGAVTLTAESASVVVRSTNDSVLRLYWMVRPAAAAAPTKDAIETTTALSGNVSVGAEGSQRISVRDLAPGTAYKFYALFKVAANGVSSAVSSSESFTALSYDPALGFSAPSLSLFPNPVEDALFVQSSASGTALLYDLSGVLLDRRAITSGTSKLLFTDHPPGLYLVRFVFADGEIIRRVVRR